MCFRIDFTVTFQSVPPSGCNFTFWGDGRSRVYCVLVSLRHHFQTLGGHECLSFLRGWDATVRSNRKCRQLGCQYRFPVCVLPLGCPLVPLRDASLKWFSQPTLEGFNTHPGEAMANVWLFLAELRVSWLVCTGWHHHHHDIIKSYSVFTLCSKYVYAEISLCACFVSLDVFYFNSIY